MINILFISIAFPPKNDPECLQTAKYFKELIEDSDLSLEVITSKDKSTSFMPFDSNLLKYSEGNYKKIQIPIFENKYFNFLLRKILPEGIDWPDSKFTFHKQWRRAVKKIKNTPDIIYSRSFPLSSTLMALKIQKQFNVPWILHLSDPWAYSPLHSFSKKQFEYHKNLEKLCFERASKICFTSQQTVDFYSQIYQEFKDKFEIFPNVYEKSNITENPILFEGKLRIIYTGGLVKDRSAIPIIKAFEILQNEIPDLEEKVEVIFAGALDHKNKAIFNNCSLPFITHIGELSYPKALKLQRSSHLLLILDNPIKEPKKAMFFPSKLLDYISMKRRILAITTKGGATSSVMQELLGEIYEHEEVSKISESIKKSIDAFEEKDAEYFVAANPSEKYEVSYNLERLKTLFKEYSK